ncbi:ATP-binding protein [Anaerolineales bacterium HSG25]|nr:ATP-binding protein [Anaerolineales bacterium HSG25]
MSTESSQSISDLENIDLQELQKAPLQGVIMANFIIVFFFIFQGTRIYDGALTSAYLAWWASAGVLTLTTILGMYLFAQERIREASISTIAGLSMSVSILFLSPNTLQSFYPYIFVMLVAISGLIITPEAAFGIAIFNIVVSGIIVIVGLGIEQLIWLIIPSTMCVITAFMTWNGANNYMIGYRSATYSKRKAKERGDELFNSQQQLTKFNQLLESANNNLHNRSHQLEVIATLSEKLNSILDFENLLLEFIGQIETGFDYYHAHVYLLSEDGKYLFVAEGTGEVARTMKAEEYRIFLDTPTSLIAKAARNKEMVKVDDVRNVDDWMPNKLLPNTYSEMAVPIIAEQKLVGVLDVQENVVSGFDEADANMLRSLANQLAIAITNARLFAELEDRVAARTAELSETNIALEAEVIERKQAEKEILRMQKFLNAIVENIPNTVFVKDALKLQYVLFNKAGAELTGYSHDERLGKTDYEFYPEGEADFIHNKDKEVLANRILLDIPEEHIHTRHNGVRILHTKKVPILGPNNEPQYLLGVSEDITERKAIEEELEKHRHQLEDLVTERTAELEQRTKELTTTLDDLKTAQQQLVESEKMASLGGLVAGVAHEINTPLGVGITAASILDDETRWVAEAYGKGKLKGSNLKDYLSTAEQSSQSILSNLRRAGELVQSFKQVAVDQTNLEKRMFGVADYIDNTLLSLRPKFKRTNHVIGVEGDEGVTIKSYPGAFSQIITNLLMNSIKHAYKEDEYGHLTFIVSQTDENHLRIEYSDDGCGISPEHLKKIFEPFFTTARSRGGTGLGMHIVYNLVTQKLKGTIRCESDVGVGTKFILDLPIQV